MPDLQDISEKYIAVRSKFGTGPSEGTYKICRDAVEMAKTVSPAVDPARNKFLEICTVANLDHPLAKTLSFPKRFSEGSWKSQSIAGSVTKRIYEVLDFLFILLLQIFLHA